MVLALKGFILLIAAVCAIAAYMIWKRLYIIRSSIGWPKITCEITRSNIKQHDSHGKGSASYLYVPDIHYRYNVGGVEYMGNTLSYDLSRFNAMPKNAVEKCKEYPEGSRSHVYYNRNNPVQSCLEKPYKLAALGNRQVIILMIAVAGLLAMYAKLFM